MRQEGVVGPRFNVLSSKSIQPSDLWSSHLLDDGPLYPETFDIVHLMSSPLNPPKLEIQGIMEQFGMEGTISSSNFHLLGNFLHLKVVPCHPWFHMFSLSLLMFIEL